MDNKKNKIRQSCKLKGKKSYSDNLDELGEEELFDGLLGYGLFAEKIPPFLSSEKFLSFCKSPPSGFTFSTTQKKYIHYESMRNINIPRVLAIPNPIAYRNQCFILRNNWGKLQKYFKKKTKNHKYKISRIHVRKIDNTSKIFKTCHQEMDDINLNDCPNLLSKHIFEMNYKNFITDDNPEPDLLIDKNYIVKADISSCFPSIYSHSIPWSLVGKTEAKKNKKNTEWYNKIDVKTRNLKDAETNGILIGPHSSNLISEIVLVAVDEVLSKKYSYIRNIDDYTCYVKTHKETEQFLVDLSQELGKYNLLLNHKKTEILKLPIASTKHWIRKINAFVFPSDKGNLKLNEVRAFLDIALDLMSENKTNSAILNYAIKVLSNKKMAENAKNYFVKTIHHLVLIYPYLIPLLEENVFDAFSVDVADIKKIANNIFAIGKDKKLYEAMSYALYFGLKYDFKLIDNLYEIIEKNRDTVLMTLAYLHDKKFPGSSTETQYETLAKSLIDDIDEYWIFVYEVLAKESLKEEWKTMKNEGVSFIKDGFIEKPNPHKK
ncbi:MAG: RNA-directed DNA polymerase [Sulfurospirillum sp.]|nr:RNA-directed DNA polymerase [Sulfurospirillum sp.]